MRGLLPATEFCRNGGTTFGINSPRGYGYGMVYAFHVRRLPSSLDLQFIVPDIGPASDGGTAFDDDSQRVSL